MRKKSSRFGLRRTSARIAWADRPGQRPPLRAEARLEPLREAPPHPERLLQRGPRRCSARCWVLWSKTCQKRQRSDAPAAGDPALVLGLDELAPGVLGEEALEARHRPAGQAGAGQAGSRSRAPIPAPSASAWASAFSGASTRPKPPQRQATRCATRPMRGSPATAAASAAKVGLGGAGVEVDQRAGVRGGGDQRARELGRLLGAVMGEDQEEELHRGAQAAVGHGRPGTLDRAPA